MWTTILSPKSLTPLSTPLTLYYKSYLAVAIGSATADKVIRYSFAFSAKIDEAPERVDKATTAAVGDESNDLQQTLKSFFYPTLGILRGLIKAGFAPEDAEDLISDMLDFAPPELSRRSRP